MKVIDRIDAYQRRHRWAGLAGRTGTWLQLVRDAPPSVLAEALGIFPATAMRHAELAGSDYLSYPNPLIE